MKYYSKRLIIWRSQVQALDGPPKTGKQNAFLFFVVYIRIYTMPFYINLHQSPFHV